MIIGLIVVIALGAFWWLNRSAGPGQNLLGGKTPTTFAELMAMGEDYTCTFSDTDEENGTVTNGKIYVADGGKKFNGSFEIKQDESTMQSYIIQDGEYSYFWSSETKQGYKMKINPEDNQLFATDDEETSSQTEQLSFDKDEPMDFSCQPWKPDNKMFTPPSDIEFIDFDVQLEQMKTLPQEMINEETIGETTEENTESNLDCSVCDQIPAGDSRDQCLATLGC
ncbi:MAG: hypothetical protein A2383_01480 [Candidatus Pacebacteria bacterium RIFOXYB1_FULL_39_46]|nr:MAG: hypothetical protein A2383_01480 [Candidatus Pacebacteria bacterium RIFOXYB1_FULL_39_46]OGJ39062.1 MAG: hypothetical protein A2182_01900 [Candidatus Pacebacteria bacterium RIFOXYA1_FULL_38_18]OGJ40033.1 MAG: hypothetical protein A2582_01425 [Candidatus Pacebacteria bacterium RIFOXYD1_FULL_39_27]OGJ40705.1 MAG: hypothetical protein A2411_00270 [Candidatus Pacebacteria bacterium RIFOXYC1_FULL_39_21]